MREGSEGRYPVKVDLLKQRMEELGFSVKSLAKRANIDISSLRRMLKGRPAFASTLEKFAPHLKLRWTDLVVGGKPTGEVATTKLADAVVVVPGTLAGFTEAEQKKILQAIDDLLGTGLGVRLVKKEPGSVKLTLRMTQEDADRLAQAIREGKLADVGVTDAPQITSLGDFENPADAIANPEILGPSEAPRPVHWLIRTIRSRRLRTVTSIASIVCSLLGFFPIEAYPLYILGLFLSVCGAALTVASIKRRWISFAIPAIGLVLNGMAIWAWPNVIGLFDTGNGYSIQSGERTGEVQFVLGDDFPQAEGERGYRIIVSEWTAVPDPAKVRFYDTDVANRKSDAIRVPARKYYVYVLILKHNIYRMHRVRIRATSQIITLDSSNRVDRLR